MTDLHTPRHSIDTHQHLWVISERSYDWLVPEYGPIFDDFRMEDVSDDINASGITGTVLVQAADTYEDTFYMLSVAEKTPSISGVVAWVPLDRPEEAAAALSMFKRAPIIKGVRNLTHNYEDPRWILRPEIADSLKMVEEHGYTLDMVSVNSEHNHAIVALAKRHPGLKIVIDHMSKPPVAQGELNPWSDEMSALALEPNVFCKISGLNTASGSDWTFNDWQPYVDHVVANFGSNRVMLGSDWPVSILNGDFQGVWKAQREVISNYTVDQQDDIYFRSASNFYSLGL